uniref:Uncharacterized protein n=1 Tax=Arundo donax TaxID=35708 RepID=A0A0A9FSX0_ARUDO
MYLSAMNNRVVALDFFFKYHNWHLITIGHQLNVETNHSIVSQFPI